ncbi:hypothetical protein DEJ28_00500 [Curtobacterium sp. MCPF17_002]|uniref:hypothetical protein n=1 Tax=Curtobacterium sp. MCPF17_002 TaxID=2175645 RepID=UPI000DA91149|nr:hypothetical protein [Curtobacterium sp. MCPF17_002]WIB77608.1 hypothetical protein DEJ28_00500 [Curtobacterium sp. MCPF17_002]
MVITIEDDVHSLLDLLWIREARQLATSGDDLPPHLSLSPVSEPVSDDEQRRVWSHAWPEVWRACLAHAGEERDPFVFDQLALTSTEADERRELLARLFGPSWQDSFGDAVFTEQYEEWNRGRFAERTSPGAVQKSPEQLCLRDLVGAWQAGLTKIIEIPCRGTFTRRVGDHALLVTAPTREAPDAYAEALRSFA